MYNRELFKEEEKDRTIVKCPYHDDLKNELTELNQKINLISDHRIENGVKIEHQEQKDKELNDDLKQIKESLRNLNLSMHQHFATKKEVSTEVKNIKKEVKETDGKINQVDTKIDNVRKELTSRFLKVVAITITVVGLVLAGLQTLLYAIFYL